MKLSKKKECPKAFDHSKFDMTTKKGYDEYHKAWNQLCAETPSKEEACRRIRQNQELYLEHQQKCLNKYDPTLQLAIEHAGDIIRELSKCGWGACHLPYVEEKMGRLRKRLDEMHEERGL